MIHFQINMDLLTQDKAIKLLRLYDELQTELNYQEEVFHRGWFEHALQVIEYITARTSFKKSQILVTIII